MFRTTTLGKRRQEIIETRQIKILPVGITKAELVFGKLPSGANSQEAICLHMISTGDAADLQQDTLLSFVL